MAIAAAAAAAALIAGCGSGPGSITAKGTAQDCTGSYTDGTQVAVTDSTGKVLATGALAADNSRQAQQLISGYDALQVQLGSLSGANSGMAVYDFTVTVPGGQPRYGITIGSSHGTIWETPAQMRSGPGLSLGC
jgi:hypothetical protein